MLPGHFLKFSTSFRDTGHPWHCLFFFIVRNFCINSMALYLRRCQDHFSTHISVKLCLGMSRFVTCKIYVIFGYCLPLTCSLRVNRHWHVLSRKWAHCISIDSILNFMPVILTIRTWAVWGRSRRVAIFLSIFFAAMWIPGFIVMGFWEGTVECKCSCCHVQPATNWRLATDVSVPREIVPSGCWPEVQSSSYYISYVLLAIFEGGVLSAQMILHTSVYWSYSLVLLIMMSIKAHKAREFVVVFKPATAIVDYQLLL
jgi:hypothetical protein